MELAIPDLFVPVLWNVLLVLCQQVYRLTQNHPRHEIIVEVGKRVQAVQRTLERLARRGPGVTDQETMDNVERYLNAIRDEIMRIQKMNHREYRQRRQEIQNRLDEMFRNIHENIQLLSTNLVVDIHQHVVQHTRLAEDYARLAAENARLWRHVGDSARRQEEENAHVPTMQQSVQGSSTEQELMHDDAQGNATLVPYVAMSKHDEAPLLQGNATLVPYVVMSKQDKGPLVPYCIGDASIPFAECLGRIDLDSSSENHRPDEVFEGGEPVPFIHFHHTCDGCMMFPIIGKRFRAMNHRDFDLCQGCFSNSNITCLSFEETEVVSDRHHQLAWRRALGLEKD